MSHDISLLVNGNVAPMEGVHIGGTMPMGGYKTTDFNITYNYSKHYGILGGVDWLYGKTGKETASKLLEQIIDLKQDESNDYWEATEGNARKALLPLLEAAIQYPEGIWEGD